MYHDAVVYLDELGALRHDGNQFLPDQTITRVEFLAMVASLMEVPPGFSASSAKIDETGIANWAKGNKLIPAGKENSFAPDEALTKEEAIQILYQFSDELESYDYLPMVEDGQELFVDDDEISPNAVKAVTDFYDAGFLSVEGDDALHPADPISKGEVAQLLYRYHLLTTKPDIEIDGFTYSYEGTGDLTPEELAANDAEAAAYAATLQSQSDEGSSETSDLEESPHGVSYFAIPSVSIVSDADGGEATLSWAGKGHNFIIYQAFIILQAKTSTGFAKYNKACPPKMSGCSYTKGIDIVKYYSVKTDDIENGPIKTYAGHFYDPDKGDSYMPGTSYKNAYRNFNDHHYSAIVQWKSGQKKLGYKELGMALHYLEDLNTPHHAANKIAGLTKHKQYESWFNHQIASNTGYYAVYSAPEDTYNYTLNSTFIKMANNWASLAKSYWPTCEGYMLGQSTLLNQTKSYTKAALATAQRGSAGILYRYLKVTGQM